MSTVHPKIKPYRICAFGTCNITKGKRTKTVQAGWDLHNPILTDHWAHKGRLAGSGSFSWLATHTDNAVITVTPEGCALPSGISKAIDAAFADNSVSQVQLRTEQDRKLLIFNRHSDRRVTVYHGGE